MPDQTASVAPFAAPDELAALHGVTTFTWMCVFGCTVEVVDGHEQPHDCAGERLIAEVVTESPASVIAQRVAEALKPLLRDRGLDAWKDGVESGRRGLCYGVDDDVDAGTQEPPLAVERARTHAALAMLGISPTWFRRVEITGKKVTVEQYRTDDKGRLAKAGDDLSTVIHTVDVVPDAS